MRIQTAAVLALLLVVIAPQRGTAQTEDFEPFREFFSRSSWETASYGLSDHVGYEYYGYLSVPEGGYQSWDYQPDMSPATLTPRPDLAGARLYVGRTGGVFRGEWYSPDEIGRIFRENGLFYGSMGSSLVETTWIIKKYGLRHLERIPGHINQLGLTGFTDQDYARYRDSLQVIMERHREELRDRERAYDVSIIDDPETLWLLTGSGIMHVFLDSLEHNYDRFNQTFREDLGFDIPLVPNPATPVDQAEHSLFLQWVRTRMHSLMALQVEVFHEVVAPPGRVISNIHGEDVIDFERQGAIVDHPGPSARAQFSDREMVLRYWNGYIFRLWRDLTDRPLFASSRINNGVIRARSIPTTRAVELWHDQALQNGTVGFYQWLKDYGPRDEDGTPIITPTSFDGPAFANPDPSTLGEERWQAVLDISRTLSRTRTFDPPTSETGILVSFDALNIHGWDRVFSTYVELTKAGVWSSFLSDREILDGSEDLNQWKVLYVPVLDFTHTEVAHTLQEFVSNGGVLVSLDPTIFSHDMQGNDLSYLRQEMFGVGGDPQPAGPRSVRLDPRHSTRLIHSPDQTYDFDHAADVDILGTYPDGGPAVVARRLGSGQTIYWGAPLGDVYAANPFGNPELDGRGIFYKRLEAKNGIADRSWIWDITFRNLHAVTGTGEPDLPPVRIRIPLD